ncbi:MAG: hypothetical protein H0W64_07905 [Gammaproteobacteria bacterium]|nr:hypothetical protein [Gammaproteobacteria bacterium]
MLLLKNRIKKIIILCGTAGLVSLFLLPTLRAESTSEGYLKKIMENTYGTLVAVNDLPAALARLVAMAESWLTANADAVAEIQADFGQLGNLFVQNATTQTSLQSAIVTQLFADITPQTLPEANDLAFQTLLGMPVFAQDPRNEGANPPAFDNKLNYVKNAAGMSLNHPMPELRMNGRPEDQLLYRNYYSTVMAVESFNAYLLSGLYADFNVKDDPNNPDPQKRTKSLTTLQNDLVTQASSSDWFTKVFSEELGLVLRQMLMYESQVFVMLTQLVQMQKQLVIAQAMTNTLLMANNVTNEQSLFQRANKSLPLP